MVKVVFLRHGESTWNQEGLFTGWTDVDLSEKGIKEAHAAGKLLKENGFKFDFAFTSYLRRAIRTLNITLDILNQLWIPTEKSWLLNERHYGALQGLNKKETAKKYGDEQVFTWRRSFDIPPPALKEDDERNPYKDIRYSHFPKDLVPLCESLKDTCTRAIPYWQTVIWPKALKNNIIVAAHGNSLRAIVKHIDNISDKEISSLNIPTGVPLVYEFDDHGQALKHYYLGDQDAINAAINQVANQGKA